MQHARRTVEPLLKTRQRFNKRRKTRIPILHIKEKHLISNTLPESANGCASEEGQKWNRTIQTSFAFPIGKQTGTKRRDHGGSATRRIQLESKWVVGRRFKLNERFGSLWGKGREAGRQGGRQWLTEHFRLQGTAVLKENSDDLHLIAEKPGASAARAGQRHRRAPAPLGCHLQRAAAICSALPQTHRKLIFWQNTGINMTFKQVVLSQAEHGRRAKLKLHTCHV